MLTWLGAVFLDSLCSGGLCQFQYVRSIVRLLFLHSFIYLCRIFFFFFFFFSLLLVCVVLLDAFNTIHSFYTKNEYLFNKKFIYVYHTIRTSFHFHFSHACWWFDVGVFACFSHKCTLLYRIQYTCRVYFIFASLRQIHLHCHSVCLA